ncbi:MAG: FtsX-like permease family protein, partial [Bacteroidales bacterium]|nr:FtsX-like permease family protein [Bacteroidales bacterium]
IAGFMLIMIYIYGELSYDRHHPDYRNTYRVAMDLEMSGNITRAAVSGGLLGVLMHQEIKEVASYTRMVQYPREVLFTWDDRKLYFDHIMFADSSFFDFFQYDPYLGDASEALRKPYSLVLTRSSAKRIFGDTDPIGKQISWDNGESYVVRAVIEDPVYPSHIQFGALASFSTLENIPPYNRFINMLSAFVTFNYVKLHEGYTPDDIKAPLDSLVLKHMGEDIRESGAGFSFYLQPVKDIHLHSHLRHEISENGNINNVYIFTAVAAFILLIACINFIILATARASTRLLEVGVRKVYGALRRNLVCRFMIESVLTAIIGMSLAIGMIEVMLPEIEQLAGSDIHNTMGNVRHYIGYLLLLTLVVGLLSGIYPSIVIASQSPLGIIQRRSTGKSGKPWFRNVMVTLQFLITIFLICGTVAIYLQIEFVKNKDTGISLDNKIVIPLRGKNMIDKYTEAKGEFNQIAGVEAVTSSSSYPGNFRLRRAFYPEGASRNDMWMLLFTHVEQNFFDVMDIDLILGQGFSKNHEVDSLHAIVNEALVREAGWNDPLGKFVAIPGQEEQMDIKYRIIGVVQDFNYASLHESVKPLLILHDPGRAGNITIEVNPVNFAGTMQLLEEKWDELYPGQPFNYFILSENFNRLYNSDIRLSEVFVWFTLLAVFIACMGLFGLSAYMTEQKSREIGIRKVLGSSSFQVILMFVKSYYFLIFIAALLAIPLSWYAMDVWLQNFSARTPLYWWIFALSAVVAMLVAGLTIAAQSYRAASRNPVDSIRWE